MRLRTTSERQIHANRAQEGEQIERISTNTNVSYENTGRNTVIYAGNGTGENESRRIWRVRNRPTSLSEVAGPSCIRNDRGEETREHNSCPASQDEPTKIPTDVGQSELTEGRTQMTEVNIEMHDSMQMVVHEPQVDELVLVVQPNPFQLLAGEELEGESLHETEYFEDHLYAYENEKASRDWFTKGDKGTAYFFNCLKERKNRSAIRSLTTHDGVQLNAQDQGICLWLLTYNHDSDDGAWLKNKDPNGIEMVPPVYLNDLRKLNITKETFTIPKKHAVPVDKGEITVGQICCEQFLEDQTEHFLFPVKCRARPDPPLPHLFWSRTVYVLEYEILEDMDKILSCYFPLPPNRALHVAGSTKLAIYETDFGWGNPTKSVAISTDITAAISLCDLPNEIREVEIG
ncbi:hypothetical protein IFM89_027269 [Coptis chinensis]|uniref:Uncharacterized protein n=1 Tax=Coptis chinensis TaxID=261450 RepID=A0A835GZN1_9MAGN|nr:hypothetical protein IFM89_027269 [Coptis chinensis]